MTRPPLTTGISLIVAIAGFACFASAETIAVHMRTQAGAPLAGETVRYYRASDNAPIDSQVTDAAGDCVLTDTTYVGQSRCVQTSKSGWTIFIGTTNDPAQARGGGLICQSIPTSDLYIWARRDLSGATATVVGGRNGYVNPNQGDQATVYFTPSEGGSVTLHVTTLAGKKVFTSDPIAVRPNLQAAAMWNGRNASGQVVASGIYLARLVGAGLKTTVKIAVVDK